MVRLHIDPARLAGDTVIVDGEAHRYLTRVLRLAPGDMVTLFDGRGGEVDAEIERVTAVEVRLLARGRRAVAIPAGPELVLIQALPKGEKLDLVVQKATELGVHRVVPARAARSVVRLDEARARSRVERLAKIAREAARQSGRADVPDIAPVADLDDALGSVPPGALRILLHEGPGTHPLKQLLPAQKPTAVALAIGPEGGFTDDEVARAREAGFVAAGLGPRVLRTETAALAALAILQFTVGDLG
jgi:16S rRNA (uracil1498-N3)-methyltransferase